MMPLENSVENTLYYKTEEGNYKELNNFSKISEGFTLVAEGISKFVEQIIDILSNAVKELSFSFKAKHISRKRFKKLLMGHGYQRNEAELIANIVFRKSKCYTMFDVCAFFKTNY